MKTIALIVKVAIIQMTTFLIFPLVEIEYLHMMRNVKLMIKIVQVALLKCEHGFYINQYTNICESKCGDGIITYDEDCEDNNNIEYDGCYYCKYSCKQQSLNCIKGVCLRMQQKLLLWDGFCYGEENEIGQFPECKENIYRQCLMCQKDNNLNEYGDFISECLESCDQCCDGQCFQCIELYENICILPQQCQTGLKFNQENKFVNLYDMMDLLMDVKDAMIKIWSNLMVAISVNISVRQVHLINYELDQLNNSCKSIKLQLTIQEQPNCKLFLEQLMYFLLSWISDLITNTCIIEQNQQMLLEQQIIFFSQCLEYEFGYYGNKFLPKFGDGILVQQEECNDANLYETDSCLNCKYMSLKLQLMCLWNLYSFFFGSIWILQVIHVIQFVVIICQQMMKLVMTIMNRDMMDVSNVTLNVRQNVYIANLESVQNDNLLQWQYNQKVIREELNLCDSSIGFYQDDCGSNCLPLYVVAGNEQCEDQNNIPYDGCYECQIQCQIVLLLYRNSCIPNCGDGFVINDYEDCDDQKAQPYDGCFECQFQCTMNCLICSKGTCLQSDIDYSFENNKCLLKKQNDDPNSTIFKQSQKNNDTILDSQNSQLELLNENKICQQSEFVYSQKSSIKLTFKNQSFTLQHVEITFEQYKASNCLTQVQVTWLPRVIISQSIQFK
ncbi:unnamed protein product [Paramecium sonneborni]|uniref:Uncharacterized protein n=1 Tax=Paramecium sonneborni TaxID=65129 RepID=A0A8S1L1X4_9CILI|nr:unnamed protein product [Paramecium sonneborni]